MKFLQALLNNRTATVLRRLETDENYRFLRDNYLFKDLSPEASAFLISHLLERHYNSGELIFKEGNPSICLFVVKRGSAEIFVSRQGQKLISETVDSGRIFGEISVVSSIYRTASARAIENDTVLLVLSSFDLEELMKLYPRDGLKLLKGITDTITAYLIETTERLRDTAAELHATHRRHGEDEAG